MTDKPIIEIAMFFDRDWIEKIYKESKRELGSFNLFYSWDNFLEGKNNFKFHVIRPFAFVRWGWMPKYESNVIQEIGVDVKARGQGFAGRLLNAVPTPLLLKCNQDNNAGNAFYKKMGMTLSASTETKKGVKQNIWTLNKTVCAESSDTLENQINQSLTDWFGNQQ
jgi:GNAT superfamily N-acetyltransferase